MRGWRDINIQELTCLKAWLQMGGGGGGGYTDIYCKLSRLLFRASHNENVFVRS